MGKGVQPLRYQWVDMSKFPMFPIFKHWEKKHEKTIQIPWDFSPFIIIRTQTPNMACIQQTTLLCGSPNCRHWNVNSPALCFSPGQEHHEAYEAHPLFGPGKLVHLEKFESVHSNCSSKKNDDPSFEALKLPQWSIKNPQCLAQNFLRNPTRPAQQGLRRQRSPVGLPSSLHGTLGEKYDFNNQRLIIVYNLSII